MKNDIEDEMYFADVFDNKMYGCSIRKLPSTDLISIKDLSRACNLRRAELGRKARSYVSIMKGRKYLTKKLKIEAWYRRTHKRTHGVTFIHPLLAVEYCLIAVPGFEVTKHEWLFNLMIKYKDMLNGPRNMLLDCIFDDYQGNMTAAKAFISKMNTIINRSLGIAERYNHVTPSEKEILDKVYDSIRGFYWLVEDKKRAVYYGLVEVMRREARQEEDIQRRIEKAIADHMNVVRKANKSKVKIEVPNTD